MLKLNAVVAALAGLSLCLAPLAPAAAQSEASGPAYVDLPRVLAEYRKTSAFARHAQKLRDQSRIFNEEMRTLAQVRYCTEAERKEALAIRAKPNPSPAEKARFDALVRKTEEVEREHAVLSQKPNPSEEETRRLQEIAQLRRDALQMMAKEENDRRDQLRKMDQDAMLEVQNELLKLVERVAKEQKIPVVYNRTAVLFGGTDLTDAVIRKLPK